MSKPAAQLTDAQREARRESKRRYRQSPKGKAKAAEWAKEYYARPEVVQRYVDRCGSEEHKAYCKQWRSTDHGKALQKAKALRQSAFTLELWATLMQAQGGACAICRKPFTASIRSIHADHCHEEFKPRGLLCLACNTTEGLIRKTGLKPADFARRLEAYLSSPPAAAFVTKEEAGIAGSKELA